MSSVSRRTTYVTNQIIDATVHNQEHDDYVNGINDNDTRITNIENGNLTLTGNKTFSNDVTLNGTTIFGGVEGNATAGTFATTKDIYSFKRNLRASTTDATVTVMTVDLAGNKLTISNNTAWFFTADVVGMISGSGTGSVGGYKISGCIKNIAGTTALVGAPSVTNTFEDAAAWDITATANNTDDTLEIKVTGAAATTIRWVATIQITQSIFN